MKKPSIDYLRHVLQWKESGLTKSEYCSANKISYDAFYYHFKKDQGQGLAKDFVELNVSNNVAQDKVAFHYSDGSYFIFPCGISSKFIHQAIFGC